MPKIGTDLNFLTSCSRTGAKLLGSCFINAVSTCVIRNTVRNQPNWIYWDNQMPSLTFEPPLQHLCSAKLHISGRTFSLFIFGLELYFSKSCKLIVTKNITPDADNSTFVLYIELCNQFWIKCFSFYLREFFSYQFFWVYHFSCAFYLGVHEARSHLNTGKMNLKKLKIAMIQVKLFLYQIWEQHKGVTSKKKAEEERIPLILMSTMKYIVYGNSSYSTSILLNTA